MATWENGGVDAEQQPNSYENWKDRGHLLALQKYAPLRDLINFVNKEYMLNVRSKDAPTRYQIFHNIKAIRLEAPFNEYKRFPKEYWVNLSVGPIADALNRVQAAFDIPNTNPKLGPYIDLSDLETTHQKFELDMADLRRCVYLTDRKQMVEAGIYNRSTFEAKFGMEWIDVFGE